VVGEQRIIFEKTIYSLKAIDVPTDSACYLLPP
jgi:hypothetical protein